MKTLSAGFHQPIQGILSLPLVSIWEKREDSLRQGLEWREREKEKEREMARVYLCQG